MYRIDGSLTKVKLEKLRPTQVTVGYREVEAKRKKWAKLDDEARTEAMGEELFPAVIGPKKAYYILDSHHTALALYQEKAKFVQVGTVKDLSGLSDVDFWIFLDHYSWVHPYDTEGRRLRLNEVPRKLQGLHDDPYRSLAADVRDHGGFAKVDTPYLEFLWANYLRGLVPGKMVEQQPKAALHMALQCAAADRASHLPGWVGKTK